MNEDAKARQLVRTTKLHGVPSHANASDYYFPVNLDQVKELEKSLFTRLEMLNLSKKAEDASKIVFQEQIWQWFYDVQDNCVTSTSGCIAPVVITHEAPLYSNRWGFMSDQEYAKSIALGEDDVTN